MGGSRRLVSGPGFEGLASRPGSPTGPRYDTRTIVWICLTLITGLVVLLVLLICKKRWVVLSLPATPRPSSFSQLCPGSALHAPGARSCIDIPSQIIPVLLERGQEAGLTWQVDMLESREVRSPAKVTQLMGGSAGACQTDAHVLCHSAPRPCLLGGGRGQGVLREGFSLHMCQLESSHDRWKHRGPGRQKGQPGAQRGPGVQGFLLQPLPAGRDDCLCQVLCDHHDCLFSWPKSRGQAGPQSV